MEWLDRFKKAKEKRVKEEQEKIHEKVDWYDVMKKSGLNKLIEEVISEIEGQTDLRFEVYPEKVISEDIFCSAPLYQPEIDPKQFGDSWYKYLQVRSGDKYFKISSEREREGIYLEFGKVKYRTETESDEYICRKERRIDYLFPKGVTKADVYEWLRHICE